MSLKHDAFPSSEAFDLINNSLNSDDAERKDAVKKGNAIFAFTLQNKEGQTESWYIDLKEKGEVARGTAPDDKKANGMITPKPTLPYSRFISYHLAAPLSYNALALCHTADKLLRREMLTQFPKVTLSLSDDDFGKLISGKANAQRLFMAGKLKVQGDVMKATKMEPILKRAQTKAKL
ncbi:hypothetical protein MMC16_000819 [Acarospora aff. strigata]|nr:hypothetical protein [Acarospora aff. strigata]